MSVLLEQANLALVEGLQYELRFTARSEIARDIEVTLENAQYNRYFNEKVQVGAEEKTILIPLLLQQQIRCHLNSFLGKVLNPQ